MAQNLVISLNLGTEKSLFISRFKNTVHASMLAKMFFLFASRTVTVQGYCVTKMSFCLKLMCEVILGNNDRTQLTRW